jgi:CheY-like chemotaxis protein
MDDRPVSAGGSRGATPAGIEPSIPDRDHDRSAGGRTILVAEDEPSVRAVIVAVLEQQGYSVMAAGDGPEALARAVEHAGTIHLILTDVRLPKLGGQELVERIAVDRPGVKVLFMSGHPEDEVLRQDACGGRANFIQKPFRLADLARRVRDVLEVQGAGA